MKRYWVFAYSNYYPLGGLQDLHLCTNDLEDAKKEVDRKTKNNNNDVDYNSGEDSLTYGFVYDIEQNSVVYCPINDWMGSESELQDWEEKLKLLA